MNFGSIQFFLFLLFKNTMNSNNLVNAVFSILFNYLLYAYLNRLENIGCDCGLKMQRYSIKSSIVLNYILILGSLLYSDVPDVTKIMIFIYNLSSTFNIFTYLYALKNEKCKCSDSIIRDIYYYYYYLNLLLILVLLTMMSILFLTKEI